MLYGTPTSSARYNNSNACLCTGTGKEKAEVFSKEEKRILAKIIKARANNPVTTGVRALVEKGEYRRALTELKEQALEARAGLEAAIGYDLVEEIRSLT